MSPLDYFEVPVMMSETVDKREDHKSMYVLSTFNPLLLEDPLTVSGESCELPAKKTEDEETSVKTGVRVIALESEESAVGDKESLDWPTAVK